MIDYATFLSWVERKIGNFEIRGDEILINSEFTHDTKYHLYCNTKKNAFHCWKTDQSGNLFQLVSMLENCSYSEAKEILGEENLLRSMEERVEKFFTEKEKINGENALQPPLPPNEIEFPQGTFLITALPPDNRYRLLAENYLSKRKLSSKDLYVCLSGKYADRIIIPYRTPDGTLIYWNGRDISDRANCKYKGPNDEEVGVGKSQVIWLATWPLPGAKIYLTEGEFDAMSLNMVGFTAGALGGKHLHNRQIELLHAKQWQMVKSYKICIALDADKSGSEALNKIGINLISNGIQNVSFVQPPKKYKDWNKMLECEGERLLMLYVLTSEQPFDWKAAAKLRL